MLGVEERRYVQKSTEFTVYIWCVGKRIFSPWNVASMKESPISCSDRFTYPFVFLKFEVSFPDEETSMLRPVGHPPRNTGNQAEIRWSSTDGGIVGS